MPTKVRHSLTPTGYSNTMTLVSHDPSYWPFINAAHVSGYFVDSWRANTSELITVVSRSNIGYRFAIVSSVVLLYKSSRDECGWPVVLTRTYSRLLVQYNDYHSLTRVVRLYYVLTCLIVVFLAVNIAGGVFIAMPMGNSSGGRDSAGDGIGDVLKARFMSNEPVLKRLPESLRGNTAAVAAASAVDIA
ncbi:hypothetical protein DFH29DRAFT_880666 [Suillus ampliporus]|nr:hypothetical protein DFH29DRAFT_880666 [Suillus ampliporus]